MTQIVPTIGRIVLFTLTEMQAAEINTRRRHAAANIDEHRSNAKGVMIHIGNSVKAGEVFPAMVVRTWGDTPTSAVNLKVMLDGSDDFWVTSVSVEPEKINKVTNEPIHTPGSYHWMPYQKAVAAGAAPTLHAQK